ncbi:hypothetical protein [Streptacidiphilus cavernicola]|uniref:WD40 repeat protein n=1 Tax=Streptacidiphilus cavernicola TaxID=3342716 RepID=A0ABV6VVV8_9ACTN
MSARTRRVATASAIALVTAVSAAVLLPMTANAAPAAKSAKAAAAVKAATVLNGTSKSNGLTISTGTRYVVMNGTRVDFGVIVRDLAWSPDGKKAAFVDGNGSLETANPDGTGRRVVAVNPGHQTWSHPTWQVTKNDPADGLPAKDNLILTVNKGGSTSLKRISATASHGTLATLSLGNYFDEGVPANPTTGNNWADGNGGYGTVVYDNTRNGEIYIRDDYLRQQGGAITKGSEPALSPNGEEIVFVRSVKGHDHIFTSDTNGAHVRDLTPGATTNYTEPDFSANGRTIAFRSPNGSYTLPATGSHTPTRVSGYTGLIAYRA